jgi:transposase-like protein
MGKGAYVPVRQDPRKMRYIAWLTTVPDYRVPAKEKELAAELDVYPRTLYNWRQDREFREVWQGESDEVIGGADRRQAVLETLYRSATEERNPRHVQAAKLYLEAIGAMQPPKLDVTISGKALGMLDDDELERLIAIGAAELRKETDDRSTGGLSAADDTG